VEAGVCEAGQEGATLRRLRESVKRVLTQHGPLTVDEIKRHVPELGARLRFGEGKPYAGTFGLGSRLVGWMCAQGTLVRTRPRGTRRSNLYEYDRLAAWLPELELVAQTPEEARVHLVHAYLAAYGPATFDDAAWWSGVGKRAVSRALGSLGERVVELELEGAKSTYLLLADNLANLDSAAEAGPGVSLLPGLDPLIMAYRDRRRFLEPERQRQVFDRAGNAFATVWAGARIVGVWRELEDRLQVLLWDHKHWTAARREAARLASFLPKLLPGEADARKSLDVEVTAYPSELYVATPFRLAER
jgi:hypothetical protein